MSIILAAGAARMKLEAENYEARISELEARIADLEAKLAERDTDLAELARRLGPRWFLEQNWFPSSLEATPPVPKVMEVCGSCGYTADPDCPICSPLTAAQEASR